MVAMASREGLEGKARRLLVERRVEEISENHFRVQGDTGTYEVRNGYCPCDASKFGNACSHARAVEIFEEEREAEIASTRARMAQIEDEVAALKEEREGLRNHLHELTTPPAELQREKEREEARKHDLAYEGLDDFDLDFRL